jgi:hypothetical protein
VIRDFVLSVFSFLVIEPFQAEINSKLRAVQAPAGVIQQVESCARAAAPVLADKALNDWWWAGTTAVSVGIGMQQPESVLVNAVPACAPAVRAAQPFLSAARD